jgi:hypothetical protein
MDDLSLRIEQIKRLRAVAQSDHEEAKNLRALAAKHRAEAERLDGDAANAQQMSGGWHEIADRLFAGGVIDEDSAVLSLTQGQLKGGRCYACDGEITMDEPDERLGKLGDHTVFVHIDRAVCKRVMAEDAETEA